MEIPVRFFVRAATLAAVTGLFAGAPLAAPAKGQDFPDTTCTCKGCGDKGGDVTGKCPSVCKDKPVFSKGSEPHDYCKAAKARMPGGRTEAIPRGGLKAN